MAMAAVAIRVPVMYPLTEVLSYGDLCRDLADSSATVRWCDRFKSRRVDCITFCTDRMPQKACVQDKTKSRVRYTRHAHAVTFCLASVQKLCCLLLYIKNTVVNLAYASKHHALT